MTLEKDLFLRSLQHQMDRNTDDVVIKGCKNGPETNLANPDRDEPNRLKFISRLSAQKKRKGENA